MSAAAFWKDLPGIEKIFFTAAGTGVLLTPYLIAKGTFFTDFFKLLLQEKEGYQNSQLRLSFMN